MDGRIDPFMQILKSELGLIIFNLFLRGRQRVAKELLRPLETVHKLTSPEK